MGDLARTAAVLEKARREGAAILYVDGGSTLYELGPAGGAGSNGQPSRHQQAALKAGLPPGATLAHKPGSSGENFGVTAATNDIGIVTLKDGRKYAVVVFLSGSTADQAAQDAIVADAMRIIARATE